MKKRRVKLLALALTASLLVPQALPVTAFSEDELAVQYVTEDYEFSDGEDCVTENFVAEDVATEDYGVEIYQEGDAQEKQEKQEKQERKQQMTVMRQMIMLSSMKYLNHREQNHRFNQLNQRILTTYHLSRKKQTRKCYLQLMMLLLLRTM